MWQVKVFGRTQKYELPFKCPSCGNEGHMEAWGDHAWSRYNRPTKIVETCGCCFHHKEYPVAE